MTQPRGDELPESTRPAGNRLKLIAGLAALAVAAGLAFLLFGSTGGRLGGPIAQAATLSSSTPGYRIQMSLEMTSSALSSPITATGRGVVDLRDRATSLSLTMNLGDEPQVIQRLGSSTMRMKMIADGATVYVKLPSGLTAALPSVGGQWIKVDLSKLSSLPGLSSLEGNPTTSDPSQILQLLRSASSSVVYEGRARVDGVRTVRYRAEVSLGHLADSLSAADRGAARQMLSSLERAFPTGQLPVDVWIDGHGLVRRTVMTLNLGLPNGLSMQETMISNLSHYGPQRPPAPPPPDQVVDLTSLGTP